MFPSVTLSARDDGRIVFSEIFGTEGVVLAVSIIVPVYNAEKTLERCLLSIQSQTYDDIEVVIVDDGSDDESRNIAKKFLSRDNRFTLIEKQNTGVSGTRNIGIMNSSGEYIQFVDSDDYLPINSTRTLVAAAENYDADMVISDFYRVYERSVVVMGSIPKFEGAMSCSEFASEMMKAPSNFYYGVMWNKLYRRDMVVKKNISCVTELKWCEDFMFNIEYLSYSKRIAVIHTPVYYYVKRPGSLVSTESGLSSVIKTKKYIFSHYRDLFDKLELYDDHKFMIRKFYIEFARDKAVKTRERKTRKKKVGVERSFAKTGEKLSAEKTSLKREAILKK